MSKEEVFNEKVTKELQSDQKYRLYVEWALKNGVIMDKVNIQLNKLFFKVDFPVAFGSNESYIVGSAAKESIGYNEAFIYIPNKLLITLERARSSEVGYIYDNHESIFKGNTEREFLILLLFIMLEYQKGEKSFWYPYFNANDPGVLSCFWEDSIINAIDDPELVDSIKSYRNTMEEDWELIQKVLKLYPDHFDLQVCNYDLYKKCSTFITTRCFGWGIPTTMMIPIGDSFNHSAKSSNIVDIVNKRLHLMKNKIYAYHFNWDQEGQDDEPYDKTHSKLKYNIKRLFREDQEVQSNQEYMKLIEGQQLSEEEQKNKYDQGEVFDRFQKLVRSEINADEFETEEAKKEKFPDHGMEIWGIGYVTSDHSQDDDEDDLEETGDDCVYNEDLRKKIFKGEELDMDEFENVSSSSKLRDIYSYRWWQDNDNDNYLVMVNKGINEIKPRQQIYYNYGKRSNAFLLQNYGFTLDESNQYNSLELRVVLGINPKEAIKHASELLPDQKILDDKDNLNTQTETIKLQPYRISDSLFSYLRSVMQNNYNGADSEYIMVSSPRLLDYELLIIEFAIDLLEIYGKKVILKRTTMEQDIQKFNQEKDFRMKFVLQHNIQIKKIYHEHIKLLKVLKSILEGIQVQQDSISRATFKRDDEYERNDDDYVVFKRRMGMRHYFKELKMNLARIKKSKMASSKAPKEGNGEEKKKLKKIVKKSPEKEKIEKSGDAIKASTKSSAKPTTQGTKKIITTKPKK